MPHTLSRSTRLAGTQRGGPSGETPASPTPRWGVSGPPDSVGASSGEPGSPQQAWQVCGFGGARPCHLAAPTLSTGARGAEGPPPSLPALPSGSCIGRYVLRPGASAPSPAAAGSTSQRLDWGEGLERQVPAPAQGEAWESVWGSPTPRLPVSRPAPRLRSPRTRGHRASGRTTQPVRG